MKNFLVAGCAVLSSVLVSLAANASSMTIRDLELKGNSTEILLDSAVEKGAIQIDYVRDIVQFTINNATIYPAKMVHADQATFSKVFAYQYSPSLVRVRFSVENNAEQFKNKVKWSVDGKKILIQFPSQVAAAPVDNERSLLDKITGADKADKKEKAEEAKAEVKTVAEAKTNEDKKEEKAEKKEIPAGSHPLNLGNGKKVKLGGAKAGPSAFRSFLAMFLIVGGLGLVLLYVKRKNSGGVQAKKAGNNWLANVFTKGAKQKQLMEVVATHVLGPKQSIVVMKIRGQQFVLAVTAENIQLITQLDSDEAELDLLDDPKVAASIGKMFGSEKAATKAPTASAASIIAAAVAAPTPAPSARVSTPSSDASFNSLLKNSTGAGAIIARNAYASNIGSNAPVNAAYNEPVNQSVSTGIKPGIATGGARDLIRKRLENLS